MIQKVKRKQALRIFLSYATTDSPHAHKLRTLLSSLRPDVRIFTDEMLSAGEAWETKLRDALYECDIFVVLLSPSSINSKFVLHELGAAWGIDKPIIPIVTHPDVLHLIPVELKHIHSLEVTELEKPETLKRILEHYEAAAATLHNSG